MGFIDSLLGRVSAADKKKLQDSEDYVTRVTGQTLQKQVRDGKITPQQFSTQYNQRLQDSTPQPSIWEKRNAALADAASRNRIINPTLGGLAQWSPTNTVANIGTFGGATAKRLGVDSPLVDRLINGSNQLKNWTAPKDNFAPTGSGLDTVIRTGVAIPKQIAEYVANPLYSAANTFADTASNQYRNSVAAGVDPNKAYDTSLILGGGSAALERIGLGKVLGNAGGTIVKRVGTSLLTEGTTEATQQLLENKIAQQTYDPNRSLGAGVLQAGGMGAIFGGTITGGVEGFNVATNPVARTQAKQEITTPVTNTANIKSDPEWKRNDLNATAALQRAAEPNTPPQLRNNYLKEAKEAIRLRNERRQALLGDGGFIGRDDVPTTNDAPQVGKTPMYRGASKAEWESVQKNGKFGQNEKSIGDPVGKFNDDVHTVGNKQYAENYAFTGGADGVVIEYKPSANQKMRSTSLEDTTDMGKVQEARGKGLTVDDVQRVTDKNGNVIYEAQTKSPRQEYITTIELGGRTYKMNEDQLLNKLLELQAVPKDKRSLGVEDQITRLKKALSDGQATPVAQVGKIDRTQLTGKQLDTPSSMFTDPNGPEATAIARNSVAKESKTPKSYEESLMQQEPAFNAPAASPTSNSGKRTLKALEDSPTIKQAEQAATRGQEINLFAKKDRNGRSVGVEQFNPETMRIESGFVVDNNGNVLGNHIKVDETGIQINIGGKVVPMNSVIGNPLDWQGSYRVTETMDRNLKRLAPDEKTYKASQEYLIGNKNQSEATFKTELRAQRQELGSQAETVKSAKPKGVSDTDFNADIFDYIEGKVNRFDLNTKYGKDTTAKIEAYKSYTKNLYDNLLTRVNETFVRFGEQPVAARKDYITHLNELTNKKSFVGDMYESLRNGILGEADGKTRGEVPSNIAGRTENFQPNKKWNRFFQRRTGDTYTKDPFKAVDAYLEPALYNVHMTESAMRARGVEAAFRTAAELKDMDLSSLSDEMQKALRAQGDSQSRLVTGFQEYANALAGKTQRLDRNIIDMGGGTALKGWQQLQRIGAQSTILGNVNSVISQTLGQPIALADVGVKNYIKGIARSFGKNPEIEQSAFIKARSTNVDSPFKSNASKVLDAGGVPLQQAELAMVKLAWNGQYEKALAKGLKGKKAILEADRATEQVVAGRGIADKPEIYRSTAANGILQYTLEVAAQNKKVWQDFTPAQKAKFVVAAFAMNSLVGLVSGQEPLPDFLGATIDTVGDFTDEEDDRNAKDKAIGGAQRVAGEVADMNPFVSSLANNTLPTDTRKKFFGEDSGVGRFEGAAAPIKVIQKGTGAVINASQGKLGEAAKDAAGLVPYGNQASKTTQGIQTIGRGYAVDSKGNPTYAAPTTIGGKAQAVVFGPNSTPNAQKFYDNNQTSITGKKDLAMINESANKLDAVAQVQQRRAEAKMNKEQKAKYDAMTDAQKQAYAANLNRGFVDEGGNLTQESASKTQAKIEKFKSELPKGISEESTKVLTNYDRLTTVARQKYIADPKNELAYTKAKLERGTLEKTLTSAQAKTLQTKIDKLSGKTPEKKTATKTTKAKSSGAKRAKFSIPSGFSLLPDSGSSRGSVANLLRSAKVTYKA